MSERKQYVSKVGFIIDEEYGKRSKLLQEICESFSKDLKETKKLLKDQSVFSEKDREEYERNCKEFEKEIEEFFEKSFLLNERFWHNFVSMINFERDLLKL